MITTAPLAETANEEGFIIDPTTGEVIAYAPDEAAARPPSEGEVPEWLVRSAMRKMLRYEARAASAFADMITARDQKEALILAAMQKVEASPEFIELDAMERAGAVIVARNENHVKAMRAFYEDSFRRFAHQQLEGTRERTWKSALGAIALQKLPARLSVSNEDQFCKWAAKHAPEAVKTSSLITKLDKNLKAALMVGERSRQEAGLTVIPESEKVTITTAVSDAR